MQSDGVPLQFDDMVDASYTHVMFVIAAMGGLKPVEQLYVQTLEGWMPLSQPFRTPFFGFGATSHSGTKERNGYTKLHDCNSQLIILADWCYLSFQEPGHLQSAFYKAVICSSNKMAG